MSEFYLTAAQMRDVERAAIDSGAVTGLDLMERAGRGAVAAMLAEWPWMATQPGRVVVLCGPGNNGGDGFVVARLLRERGWDVECFLYGDPDAMPPDARTNHRRWAAIGAVTPLRQGTWDAGPFPGMVELVIDALFGTGLSRPVALPLGTLAGNRDVGQDHRVVALDVPSGVCADSGRFVGDAAHVVRADLTIAFQTLKRGHVLADGPASCGRSTVVDIGLGEAVARLAASDEAVPDVAPRPGAVFKAAHHHKYDHGHALVLTGGFGRTGAARLAARAALRVGAGLATLAAPGAAMMECATQITAIMLRRCDDGNALTAALDDARINALCLGPGLGVDERGADLVAAAIRSGRSCVLDADALTLIAADPGLRDALHRDCVLTPHGGEFARLFPDLHDRLVGPATEGPAYSKVDAARDAAAMAGCTVLLKGPDTVIADPDGRASIHAATGARTVPWLATAGAGDVLAGMIAGLLARGADPAEACGTAAWLHVEAARAFGPGLIAEDLPDLIPEVLRALSESGAGPRDPV